MRVVRVVDASKAFGCKTWRLLEGVYVGFQLGSVGRVSIRESSYVVLLASVTLTRTSDTNRCRSFHGKYNGKISRISSLRWVRFRIGDKVWVSAKVIASNLGLYLGSNHKMSSSQLNQ